MSAGAFVGMWYEKKIDWSRMKTTENGKNQKHYTNTIMNG